MRNKSLVFISLLSAWSSVAFAADPVVTIGNLSGQAGQTVTVPITLANGTSLHALEVHVKFDPTKISFPKSAVGSDALTAGKMRVANLVAPGDYKVGILADITKADTSTSLTSYDKAFVDGAILNVTLLVDKSATGPVQLTLEASGAASDGTTIPVTVANGTVTVSNPTSPVVNFSALPDGTVSKSPVLNVCGQVSSSLGMNTMTVKGQTVTVASDGTFCRAIALTSGSNTIPIVATDTAGNQTNLSRTVSFSATAPLLTITAPADNSSSNQATITVSGTLDPACTGVLVNGGFADITAGAFTTTANLAPGMNTIDIVATTLTGTTTVKRTVFYNAAKPSVALTLPLQDISSTSSNVSFQGTVSSDVTGVEIKINSDGQTLQTLIPTLSNNAFSTSAPIDFTKNKTATSKPYEIVITATGANGSSSIQRSILFRPGDCTGDARVAQTEIQKAVNMSVGLATTPFASCADPNGDGRVSATEIQKMIINSVGL
jgi:hypothetical protein